MHSQHVTGDFILKPGRQITIPRQAVLRGATNPDLGHPHTTLIRQTDNHDSYGFVTYEAATRENVRGKIMFLPAGVKPGSVVVVTWVDQTCVCTDMVSD